MGTRAADLAHLENLLAKTTDPGKRRRIQLVIDRIHRQTKDPDIEKARQDMIDSQKFGNQTVAKKAEQWLRGEDDEPKV